MLYRLRFLLPPYLRRYPLSDNYAIIWGNAPQFESAGITRKNGQGPFGGHIQDRFYDSMDFNQFKAPNPAARPLLKQAVSK